MQVTGPIQCGQLTVTTTPQQLFASKTYCAWGVTIRPLATAANKVYVGTSNTVSASNGVELAASEQHTFHVYDASTLWIVAAASTSQVCFEQS